MEQLKNKENTDNELIAEFMGLEVDMVGVTSYDSKGRKRKNEVDLEYDNSWNELMPVVEKIASMKAEVKFSTTPNRCLISYYEGSDDDRQSGRIYTHKDHKNVLNNTLIGVTYSAVVRFIKWYNQQYTEDGTK